MKQKLTPGRYGYRSSAKLKNDLNVITGNGYIRALNRLSINKFGRIFWVQNELGHNGWVHNWCIEK